MSYFTIKGGNTLHGTIPVYGSKNAVLPAITAALLTQEPITLRNVPPILDVRRLLDIMHDLGVEAEQKGTTVTLQAKKVKTSTVNNPNVSLLRGSILLLGAFLSRDGYAALPRPGGDLIGARPIDTHLDGFSQLGATISEKDGLVIVDGKNMKAGTVVLREFSVTATENLLLACATLPGKTTIHIAATEPHVVFLCELLKKMGVKIFGAGTHTITIQGVKKLKGATATIPADMLEAGSFILMAAATQSEITVENVPFDDLHLFFKKLDDIGIQYTLNEKEKSVTVHKSALKAFKMQSMPFPGIPTDLQAPFAVVASQANGSSLIHDPLYEGRMRHVLELQKMGASAVICDPHRVIITGPTPLYGQTIPSLDLRSGATLLIAGLVATGETTIQDADIIERGYFELAKRLRALGADIEKHE